MLLVWAVVKHKQTKFKININSLKIYKLIKRSLVDFNKKQAINILFKILTGFLTVHSTGRVKCLANNSIVKPVLAYTSITPCYGKFR